MKFSFIYIFVLIALLSSGNRLSAQSNVVEMPIVLNIPTVSLIDFSGSERKIIFKSGAGAEQIITPSTIGKTWINYSSIVDGKSTNNIAVQIKSGSLPTEVEIMLEVGEDAGAGAGRTGKSAGRIKLTDFPQEIISGIGSCYTGRGSGKGHQLVFSWEWKSPYDKIYSNFDNIEIAVIYTLTNTK